MKRLIHRLFPNYVARADLTIVESDIGGDIKRLQGRIALLESNIGLSTAAIEIAAARLYAAEKRIAGLEHEVGGKASASAVSSLDCRIDAFEQIPVSCDGRATRTEIVEIVEIKPTKGRGPKGGGK